MKKYLILYSVLFLLLTCHNNNSIIEVNHRELPSEYLSLIQTLHSLCVKNANQRNSDLEERITIIEKFLLEHYPDLVSKEEDAGKEGHE